MENHSSVTGWQELFLIKVILILDADNRRDAVFLCLCFDLRETHIDRAKLFDHAESLRLREKQNQVSLVHYSIVSSPRIKRESKLFCFPKICSNTES